MVFLTLFVRYFPIRVSNEQRDRLENLSATLCSVENALMTEPETPDIPRPEPRLQILQGAVILLLAAFVLVVILVIGSYGLRAFYWLQDRTMSERTSLHHAMKIARNPKLSEVQRVAAVEFLVHNFHHDEDEVYGLCQELCREPKFPQVQRKSVSMLQLFKHRPETKALVLSFVKENDDDRIRGTAIITAASLDFEEAIPIAWEVLRTASPRMRHDTAYAVRLFSPQNSVRLLGPLMEAATDRNAKVQEQAIDSLVLIAIKAALTQKELDQIRAVLRKAQAEATYDIRERAKEAERQLPEKAAKPI